MDQQAWVWMLEDGMKTKDIPDQPILEFLSQIAPRWAFWFEGSETSILGRAIPIDTPKNLVLAKMRNLIKRGLVQGCACGCRGDFEITDKGREWLIETERNQA
jgi:hypothetical protein